MSADTSVARNKKAPQFRAVDMPAAMIVARPLATSNPRISIAPIATATKMQTRNSTGRTYLSVRAKRPVPALRLRRNAHSSSRKGIARKKVAAIATETTSSVYSDLARAVRVEAGSIELKRGEIRTEPTRFWEEFSFV